MTVWNYKYICIVSNSMILRHFKLCRERRKDQTNKIQEDLTAERTVENKLM